MVADKTSGQGLALTPPMGWNSYNTFCCEPNERLIRESVDALVDSGLRDAGYVYLNIDDGWMAKKRDTSGNLLPHPEKFPDGLKPVTGYIHSKGLKAGIYLGAGIRTYGEYPGSLGHEKADAALIAELGFDLLKYDYRELPEEDPPGRDVISEYKNMRRYLDETGRPVLFSICEHGRSKPWEWGAGIGHMWRTTKDIKDGYEKDITWGLGFTSIIDMTHHLYEYAGPGHWNDPDMLVVGLNGSIDWQGPGCTPEEYRTHFALWCLSAAPLIIGCDVRNMDDTTKEILLNRELIAVNQDPLGRQGYISRKNTDTHIWIKPLACETVAVGLFNRSKTVKEITFKFEDAGLETGIKATLRDLWEHQDLGTFNGSFTSSVKPHAIMVLKLVPV